MRNKEIKTVPSLIHAVCSERKRRNFIGRPKKGDGGWEEGEEGKREIISNYFAEIFKSNGLSNFQSLLDNVPTLVTQGMSETLLKEFTREEIKLALDSIGDLKAPGPDGLPSDFGVLQRLLGPSWGEGDY